MNDFVYWEGEESSKKDFSIFYAGLYMETGNASKGRFCGFFGCEK